METQLNLIPASEHPTALESQWLNAISPADFINNNKNFDVLMMKYRCAIREIQTKLEVLDDEFSAVNKRNPISSIKSRVKSPASIYEKLRRRDLPFTEDSIVKNLDDVAGIRVRTIGMDFWASVDHQLRYKKTIGADKDIEAIEAELLKCAQTVSETDCHMEEIKDMIGDFEKI